MGLQHLPKGENPEAFLNANPKCKAEGEWIQAWFARRQFAPSHRPLPYHGLLKHMVSEMKGLTMEFKVKQRLSAIARHGQIFAKQGLLWGIVAVVAIALSGCSLEQFRVAEAAQGTQMIAAFSENPKTFNAALSAEIPNVFYYFTYEGLLTENKITAELEPGLAESWEVSDDNLSLAFTLREGLKWSDGEPLTAEDFVFTINDVYLNEAIPANGRDGLRVGEQGLFPEVSAVDERTIMVVSPEPFAPLVRTIGLSSPLPKHALEDAVKEVDSSGEPRFNSTWSINADPREVVCNGPYVISDYAPGERVIFERNPYYWRKDDQGNPMPYIDRIIRPIIESSDNALLQFRSGGLDVAGVAPSNYSLLKKEEDRGNFTIRIGGPNSGMSFITFNLNKGSRNGKPLIDPIKSSWFNRKEFRQAVAYGIDRGTLINNLYRGIGEPQYSPISLQSPYYLSPEEGLKVYEHDPDMARQLLESAGFEYDGSGQLQDEAGNAVRFTLSAPSGSPTTGNILSQIKRDLGAIGIRVDTQEITFSSLLDKIDDSIDWECIFLGFTGGVEPNGASNFWQPEGRLHIFNQMAQPGQDPVEGREISDWEMQIGQLYTQAAQEMDEARRKAIYAEFQQIALEQSPLIYMVNPISMAAVRDRFENIQFAALDRTLFWNIYEVKVKDEN
ncbi:MAG: ABC transporter substrate-binding protein [Cyanobacteria bacterium J06635_15]